jgi:hypothetical protein
MREDNQTKFYQDKIDMDSPAVQAAFEIKSAMGLNGKDSARQISEILIIARRLSRNEEPKSLACYIVEKYCKTSSDEILRQVTAILKFNEILFKDLGMQK